MAGPLKTLYGALQASVFLTSNKVTLVFGDEETNTQRFPLPFVVMVPKGGAYVSPGYAYQVDPNTELLWETAEQVDFWCWNASNVSGAQGAVDHTDTIETLVTLLCSALQDQRAQFSDVNNVAYGLKYTVSAGRWETLANAVSPFGRAYVLSVQIVKPIVMAQPVEATITSVTQSTSVTSGQHVP